MFGTFCPGYLRQRTHPILGLFPKNLCNFPLEIPLFFPTNPCICPYKSLYFSLQSPLLFPINPCIFPYKSLYSSLQTPVFFPTNPYIFTYKHLNFPLQIPVIFPLCLSQSPLPAGASLHVFLWLRKGDEWNL